MKPFKLPLNSDSEMNLNLKTTAATNLALADVFDLVLTFTEKETGKRIARFRKTPAEGDGTIKESEGQMFIEWKRTLTANLTPCTLNLQVTEIYEDADFADGYRKQASETVEAIWLVNNDNDDL